MIFLMLIICLSVVQLEVYDSGRRVGHCACCSFAEAMVLVHFVVLAVMWLTRDPDIVPGWQSLLSHE